MDQTKLNHHAINDISDTAFWVAAYRAKESSRSDALFHDPYAGLLTADKGHAFASKASGARYVAWTVIIRTKVIDNMIMASISEGVDTILNLGAGLDTRPYRMDLPKSLRWIEVDFPKTIEFKEVKLAKESPRCHLKRVSLDLSNRTARQNFFTEIGSQSKKLLVLTEGVIIYLTEEAVSELAEDLLTQESFHYWIAEYHSLEMYKHLRNRKKTKELKNSPFQFFPENWLEFFHNNKWKEKNIVYLMQEAAKLGRRFPIPFWAKLIRPLLPKKKVSSFRKMSGFVLFEPMR